jgi:hypothetical protein
MHAVRVAARIRRELRTEVDMIRGRYGELRVLVDGGTVLDSGSLAFLGILPSTKDLTEAVRDALSRTPE